MVTGGLTKITISLGLMVTSIHATNQIKAHIFLHLMNVVTGEFDVLSNGGHFKTDFFFFIFDPEYLP